MSIEIIVAIISLVGALVGSTLGCALGYFFSKKQSKDEFNANLFSKYENIAEELAMILEEALPLSLYPKAFSREQCKKIDADLAKFFFKYYLILPPEVLEEINCMHACLQDKNHHLYMIDHKEALPTLRLRHSKNEIVQILDDVALVKRKKKLSEIFSDYNKVPSYIFIKCQARHIIVVLQRCWKIKELHNWQNHLPKTTLAERKNRIAL